MPITFRDSKSYLVYAKTSFKVLSLDLALKGLFYKELGLRYRI